MFAHTLLVDYDSNLLKLIYLKKEVIDRTNDPVNKLLLSGTDPVNNLLLTGTLSNVRRCWLAMPLGAGIMLTKH